MKFACGALSSFLVLSTSLSAANQPLLSTPTFPNMPWVTSLSVGPAWSENGTNQRLTLAPEAEKLYTANHSNNALVNGEFFIGLQRALPFNLLGQGGLVVAATSSARMGGHIWDDLDPRFDNYSYRYSVQHTHVGVKGVLLYERGYWVTPWLSGSVAAGFNNAHGFDNTPLIFEAVKNANFASHTTTAFSYTVGAGVQKRIGSNYQVGIGYQFADWGKNRLGSSLGQTTNARLGSNHLCTNGFLVSISYVGQGIDK